MYVMGFDIGTSSIKASIVDASNGGVIGTENYPEQEMEIISLQPGWAEQHPEIWWQNLCKASKKVLNSTGVKPEDIGGIGITYQMHGLVLVDKNLQVLRPSIIWCDSRAVEIGDKAFQELGSDFCLNNYLNSPGNFTASKLKWVKENEPQIYTQIHKVLLPGDYINMKFSDHLNTTISSLSEGIFWNFKEKEVAKHLLAYFDIDKELIPPIIDTFQEAGRISQKAASETGLKARTPITYRAGDQPNNAMSLSVLEKGDVGATCGTSGVVYGITDISAVDSQSRVNGFAHVNYTTENESIGTLLCINGAGIGYSWMKNQISPKGTHFDKMEAEAVAISIGSENLITLPFGNGAERIFNNRDIGAQMLNLNFNIHQRPHLYRSLLEGVAFSFVYGMNILKELGMDLNTIKVSNDNMFQSKIFASTISNVLNTSIEVIDTTGAVGAAKAAGIAIGYFNSLEEAVKTSKPIRIITPTQENEAYLSAYSKWQNALNQVLNQS